MVYGIGSAIGRAMRGIRPGLDSVMFNNPAIRAAPPTITVMSAAFFDGGTIPMQYTADGPGLSPPLSWDDVPPGTRMLVLAIEDADSPTPRPIVHAIATGLPPVDDDLEAGALPARSGRDALGMGRSTRFARAYLPPSPIPGHGDHRYVFQLFALDVAPVFKRPPGRSALLRAMAGHVLAKGMLTGIYRRS